MPEQRKPQRGDQGEPRRQDNAGPRGREPNPLPDVFVDVPSVKVDEISLKVEDLQAHLSLRARLANLVELVAGVNAHLGKVELDVKGVEAEAVVKIRLENLYGILDRALTTIDQNPDILRSVIGTAEQAVDEVGGTAQKALGPDGAVSRTADRVGEAAGEAMDEAGEAAGQAEEALEADGRVRRTSGRDR